MKWLDASSIAAMLSVSPRYVRERLALRPDFPRPLRIQRIGHPRWREDEVMEWADRERQRQTGIDRAA